MRLLPILLSRDEVRALRSGGEIVLRRRLPGPTWAEGRYGGPGDRLWAREAFSTRGDGDKIKIRYPADGAAGEPRHVPLGLAGSRYATEGYVTRPAKHMPHWASRLVLEVVESRVEREGEPPRRVAIVRARLAEAAGDRE